MAFYFKPPSGEVGLEIVRRATLIRMNFLTEVLNCRGRLDEFRALLLRPLFAKNANYLMEGTNLDTMSYFLLSLLTCGDRKISSFVQKGECQLFEFRLKLINSSEFYKFIKRAATFVSANFDKELKEIFKNLSTFGFKYLAECLENKKSGVFINLPFTCVLNFVAQRKVELNGGLAKIPTDFLNVVFLYVFEKICMKNNENLRKLQSNLFFNDPRLAKLAEDLKSLVPSLPTSETYLHSKHTLTCENVDKFVHNFPPCMLNIHRQLRQKHRVKHQARIQYTLFLKEIGMPLVESVKFWSHEYSLPDNNGVNKLCCHNWNQDHKRYVYNLRHLYGLEGARKNYSAHCCKALQGKFVNFGDDAGCPMCHFDEKSLRKFLAKEYGLLDGQVWRSVQNLIQQKQYSKSCTFLLDHFTNGKMQGVEECLSLPASILCQKIATPQRFAITQQPHSLSKMGLRFNVCYEHEFCTGSSEDLNVEDDQNKLSHMIHKPSEFYKIASLSF